jgi:hypothetical protein
VFSQSRTKDPGACPSIHETWAVSNMTSNRGDSSPIEIPEGTRPENNCETKNRKEVLHDEVVVDGLGP